MQAVLHLSMPEYLLAPNRRSALVFAALSWFADRDRKCVVTVEKIAQAAHCSVRTVQRALRDLEQAGWLVRETRYWAGKQLANAYQLVRRKAAWAAKQVTQVLGWPKKWWWPPSKHTKPRGDNLADRTCPSKGKVEPDYEPANHDLEAYVDDQAFIQELLKQGKVNWRV